MAHVKVVALQPLTYQGRSYVRGEVVKMIAVEALAAGRRGDVTLSKGAKVGPAYERKDLEAEQPKRRRRATGSKRAYKRQDMVPAE